MLLPIPAALYVLHLGEPGSADALAAFMREGGVHLARRFGADSPGALLVAAVFGTFVVPMVGFGLVWAHGRLATAQVLLAWLAQALVNTCFYLLGDVHSPAWAPLSPALRAPGLDGLALTDVSMAVAGLFFLIGAALFVLALVLPSRVAEPRRQRVELNGQYALYL